jgi:hypothetical protein
MISVFLSLTLYQYGEPLLKLLLIIYHWEIGVIDDGYQILSLNIDNVAPEHTISLQVTLKKTMYLGGHFIFPNPRGVANASSIVAHVWQMVVLFLAVIFAWSAERISVYGLRIVVGLPFLIAILLLDIPFTLLAALKGLIVQHLQIQTIPLIVLWGDFLEGGGRLALGLVAGALSVLLADLIFRISRHRQ